MSELKTTSQEILIGIPRKTIDTSLNQRIYSGRSGESSFEERWAANVGFLAAMEPLRTMYVDFGFQPKMPILNIQRQANWPVTTIEREMQKVVLARQVFVEALARAASEIEFLSQPMATILNTLPFSFCSSSANSLTVISSWGQTFNTSSAKSIQLVGFVLVFITSQSSPTPMN